MLTTKHKTSPSTVSWNILQAINIVCVKSVPLGAKEFFSAFLPHEAFPCSPHPPLLCLLCTLSPVFARPTGEKLGFPNRRTSRVAEGGGGGGSSSFSAKSTLEKTFSARVVGYFSDVCLATTELTSNDIRIHLFCVGKAIYHLNMYRGNPRDGYYFHQQKNDKTKPKTFVFEVALKRAVLYGSKKVLFRVFLNSSYEEELISFIRFWLY